MPIANPPNNLIGTQYYQTQLGIYDEMFAAEKKALPHWERLISRFEAMGSEQLELRQREAQRLLLENGVTYNVYGGTQTLNRPWQLDPVPLLISSEEWLTIETGLKQRVELLNLILKDLYTEQTLLKKGLLPSELIFGHEGFLRACMGTLNNQHHQLTFYAANLARGPNGRMWILDDRTQAPSGSGYALENRTVMSRVLPDILRDTQVHRLSSFFKSLRQGLTEIAPHNKDDPRIVILTPGPLNETYFEHAYLASFLGFSLVQGSDLTVRDKRLWLKSLSGLQPVDVILRRVDDTFCDPLELRSNSQLGVAGLLEVVRHGNVAIANPLGSSFLENPGLLAFLPGLSRHFLNEELKMPSIATWWCGQQRECDFVLQNFDNLVIKSINRSYGSHAIFPSQLSINEKDSLRAQIKAKPHLFIGQEQVSFSTLPSFIDQRIEPRNAILRNFVVASGGDYVVMLGGLTRIALQKDNRIVSNQAGGISKDTWVLASELDQSVSIWNQPKRNQLIEAVIEPLTSRVADNLFWVGRYLERIESSTRVFRTVLTKLRETLEFKDPTDNECLRLLLPTLTKATSTFVGFVDCDEQRLHSLDTELIALATDAQHSGSIAANIRLFEQAAFNIRDVWSQETWRCIDSIQYRWQKNSLPSNLSVEQLQGHLDELITGLVAFTGLTSENMPREATWIILDSGRRLERALALIALLRATIVSQHENAVLTQVLEAILVSTDSLTIYQRRYRSFIQLPRVLELLLLDENYPRSLAYQLCQLSKHLASLPHAFGKSQLCEEERLILKAYTDLRLCYIHELTQFKPDQFVLWELDSLLSSTVGLLGKISVVIAETYFSHSQASQMVVLNVNEDPL